MGRGRPELGLGAGVTSIQRTSALGLGWGRLPGLNGLGLRSPVCEAGAGLPVLG